MKILQVGAVSDDEVFARGLPGQDVADTVAAILADVRQNGDEALLRYTEKFDGARPDLLEVSADEKAAALAATDPEFLAVLQTAAANIRAFHTAQVRQSFVQMGSDGVVMGQKILPLAKVGLYVPGGTAAYPSSVLMNAIPAQIAGVGEIIMVTPAHGGVLPTAILAAAQVAGVTRIFKLGGAQAVAALAYGTESVPRVEKIVGPGNAYVAEAKKQVFGQVGIDMIAGPSEILVIADAASNPREVAADLLSQAEHDKNASAVLVTDSLPLAQAVSDEVARQLALLPRRQIAEASIEHNGKIIVAGSIAEAVQIANRLAPEHLELCVNDPFDLLGQVQNAGSVFLGRNCPEALGDYLAGPNHTLPTGGTARFSSPLSVDDFIKKTQYTYFTRQALAAVARQVEYFAEQEGLAAHARSVASRFEGGAK